MKLPQIHLRDYFWLALVIGLAFGWLCTAWVADGLIISASVWTTRVQNLEEENRELEDALDEMEAMRDMYRDQLNQNEPRPTEKAGTLPAGGD